MILTLWLLVQPPVEPPPLTLVFQATASRGPYQAGLAYAVLATHRDAAGRRLPVAGVSGSSVGGLNALLAALLTCTPDLPPGGDPTPNLPLFQVDTNPLYDLWGDLAWEALLPGDRTCDAYRADFSHLDVVCEGDTPWRPGDGLLSTNGLSDLMRFLQRRLTSGGYRPECRVPLTISLAAEDPLPLPIAAGAARITVPAARRVVEVVLETTAEGRLRICQTPPAGSPDDRFRLRLPTRGAEGPCERIDPADLLAVVRASALAPPLLPPQPVDHCSAEPCTVPGAGGGTCAPDAHLCRARFTDAFLLDPVPLGGVVERLAPPHRVLLLDPEGGRGPLPPPYTRTLAGVRFLRPFGLDTLAPVVTRYELQTLRRYGRIPAAVQVDIWQGRDRIFGDFAYGFGALVHPALRRFDFYRGVVDGLRRRVDEVCPQPGDTACREACWQRLLAEVGVERSPGLGYLLHATLVRDECGTASPPSRCPAWQAEVDRLRARPFAPRVQPFHTLYTTLAAFEAGRTGVEAAQPLRFADFVATLEDVHVRATQGENPEFDLVGAPFRDFGRFWSDTLRQIGERLHTLEVRDGDAGLRQATDLATMLAAGQTEALAQGWRLGGVSTPPRVADSAVLGTTTRLLAPYRAAGITPGGMQLDWDFSSYARGGLRLVVLGAGLHFDSDGPTAADSLLVGLTPQVGWRSAAGDTELALRFSLAAGDHAVSEPLVGPLHLGGELIFRWRALALGLGTASIGCGLDCHDPRHRATWAEGPLYFSLGIADIGGLAYWLGRAALGDEGTGSVPAGW